MQEAATAIEGVTATAAEGASAEGAAAAAAAATGATKAAAVAAARLAAPACKSSTKEGSSWGAPKKEKDKREATKCCSNLLANGVSPGCGVQQQQHPFAARHPNLFIMKSSR